jgi:uroporphyrinogen-III decarboxylase
MSIPVDVTFHPSWWHKNAGVNFNKDFFYNTDYRLEADIKMRKTLYEKFGHLGLGEKDPKPRPIIGTNFIASGFLYSEILGCEVRYSDENPPEVLCANLDDEAVGRLCAPELDKCEIWQQIQGQIDELIRRFGYVESHINLMGIQNVALDLRGSELYIDYYNNPELAHHLLDVCTKLSIDIGKRLRKVSKTISEGVTAIVKHTMPDVYLTSNCTVEMVSLDTYNEFLLKYDNMLAQEFKPFGIHHCGRTMEHVVEGYEKVRNLAFAEVGAFSDIGFVRKHLPDVYLNARYSPVKLIDVSLSELREDVEKIYQVAGPADLLSISCVGIDTHVTDEKVESFIKICREVMT